MVAMAPSARQRTDEAVAVPALEAVVLRVPAPALWCPRWYLLQRHPRPLRYASPSPPYPPLIRRLALAFEAGPLGMPAFAAPRPFLPAPPKPHVLPPGPIRSRVPLPHALSLVFRTHAHVQPSFRVHIRRLAHCTTQASRPHAHALYYSHALLAFPRERRHPHLASASTHAECACHSVASICYISI
jgi:hypothetical protein